MVLPSLIDAVAKLVDATVVDVQVGMDMSCSGVLTSPHSPTPGAAVSTDGPLLSLVKTCDNPNRCQVIALHNPELMSEAARERIFALTLPYTARAFAAAHGDPASMSEEDRLDHFQHTFGGTGIVFLVGAMQPIADGKPQFYAHMNIAFSNASAAVSQPVLYVIGVCCDPHCQGRGYASTLFVEAVDALRSKARYLTLRTMNVAVVRLMGMAGARTRSGNGVCSEAAAADGMHIHKTEPAATAPVYPVEPFDPLARPDLVAVADALAEEFGWSSMDSERLVFKAKSQGSELERRVNKLIDYEAGDALCCIVDL